MNYINDIGKPWQWVDEDGYTVTRTAAWSPPGCHPVGCGLKLYVKDGKLAKVEGDENHPVTQGRLCVRCLALTDYVNHKDRIIYPMKRAREDRGKDKWEQITLDEAYAIIKEKYETIRSEWGPESLITFSGTGRQGGGTGSTGAYRTLGTCNNCYPQSGYSCYGPRVVSTANLLGCGFPEIDYAAALPGRYDDPEFKLPEVIMLWGKEPMASNPDGLFGHAVLDMMKRGSKIISIDPRVNWPATRAAVHIRLRPGTDAALAMAMVNIIVTEKLYDEDFCSRWVYGFEEFAERCQTMSPEEAARICEVPVEEIYEAARMYANAKNASLAWGLAVDQNWNGVQIGQTLLGLMTICGNIDVPGGQTMLHVRDGVGDAKMAGKGWNTIPADLQQKLIGMQEYPLYCKSMMQTHADTTLHALETDEPYPLKMGWLVSTNVLACCGEEPERWLNALNRLEFTFATDCFMTPTIMACADLFLPLAAFPEHDAVVANHYGASPQIIAAINKAYDIGETRSDMQYMYELGKLLRPDVWADLETLEDWIQLYGLPGVDLKWEDLKEEVYHRRIIQYKKYETGDLRIDGKPGFSTRTGRIELYSLALQEVGEDPLPFYKEPFMSPVSTPDLAEKYPLILTTGARVYAFFHSEQRQIERLRALNPDPLVEIHPNKAKELGIEDGDWVVIENDYGKVKMRAKLTLAVKENVVMAQHGWWKPEEDAEAPHLYGVFDYNVNSLIPNDHFGKTGFGTNVKSALCRVYKLEA